MRAPRSLAGSAFFNLFLALDPDFYRMPDYDLIERVKELKAKKLAPRTILRRIYSDLTNQYFFSETFSDSLNFFTPDQEKISCTLRLLISKVRVSTREQIRLQIFKIPFEQAWKLKGFVDMQNLHWSSSPRKTQLKMECANLSLKVDHPDFLELFIDLLEQGFPPTRVESGNTLLIPITVTAYKKEVQRNLRIIYSGKKKSASVELKFGTELHLSRFPRPAHSGAIANKAWLASISMILGRYFVNAMRQLDQLTQRNNYEVSFDFSSVDEQSLQIVNRYESLER